MSAQELLLSLTGYAAATIIRLLYGNGPEYYLTRKYEKALEILSLDKYQRKE